MLKNREETYKELFSWFIANFRNSSMNQDEYLGQNKLVRLANKYAITTTEFIWVSRNSRC